MFVYSIFSCVLIFNYSDNFPTFPDEVMQKDAMKFEQKHKRKLDSHHDSVSEHGDRTDLSRTYSRMEVHFSVS